MAITVLEIQMETTRYDLVCIITNHRRWQEVHIRFTKLLRISTQNFIVAESGFAPQLLTDARFPFVLASTQSHSFTFWLWAVCWVWHRAEKSGLWCRSCLAKTRTQRLSKLWLKAESSPHASEEAKVWTRLLWGHMWRNMRGGIRLISKEHLESITF